MNHNIGCRKDKTQYEVPQVMAGGHSATPIIVKHDGSCTCGLDALQSRVAELEAALRECVRCVFYDRNITVEEHDKALERARALLKEPK